MASKKALITGASEGIGRALALRLAKDGWAVTAVARTESRLKDLVDELTGSGHRYLVADLADDHDIAKVCGDIEASGYDLVVNNAGLGAYGEFSTIEPERLHRMITLNCDALVELSHAFLGHAKDGDALVNVASVLAFYPYPKGGALYAATKSFVVSLSEALWFENKSKGVYAMAFCPGATKTKFHVAAGGDPTQEPPDAISQTAEQVVDALMKGLASRSKPVVVSGMMNRSMVFSSRLLGRKTRIAMMGTFALPKRKQQ